MNEACGSVRGLPLVSVIITTYKNEKFLPRAIESVLRQSYPNIQLIVVDDNSSSSDARRETERIMEKYSQALYLKHTVNKNGAAARNTGIHAAEGKYIAFLDNDDIYFSSHIADCAAALESHPECGGVLSGVIKIKKGLCWKVVPPLSGWVTKDLLLSETALGTGSNLFVRADLVREVKGFDESFIRHQDVEFGIRAFSRAQVWGIRDVQIVKEMDGHSNSPDYDRFLEIKKHFSDKFQRELKALSEEEQKTYYGGQYSALLYSACKEGDMSKIRRIERALSEYREFTGKEKLLISLTKMRVFSLYEAVKTGIKMLQSDRLFKEITKHLSEEDKIVFTGMLRG